MTFIDSFGTIHVISVLGTWPLLRVARADAPMFVLPCFFAVCVCGEFSDGCGGHVPRHLQEGLPQGAADSGDVHHLFLHRPHHVYGGKTQLV